MEKSNECVQQDCIGDAANSSLLSNDDSFCGQMVDEFATPKAPNQLPCTVRLTAPRISRSTSDISRDLRVSDGLVRQFSAKEGAPIQQEFFDIRSTWDENHKLKADLYDLKTKYYLLRQQLSLIGTGESIDFKEDYMKLRAELAEGKKIRVECNEKLAYSKKEYDTLSKRFDVNSKQWDEERQKLVDENKNLSQDIRQLREGLDVKQHELIYQQGEKFDEGNESQADSSTSIVSLMSEESRQEREAHAAMMRRLYEEQKLRLNLQAEMDSLKEQLHKQSLDLSARSKQLRDEVVKSNDLNMKLTSLEMKMEEAKRQKEEQEKIYGKRMEEITGVSSHKIQTRDKAIKVLVNELTSLMRSIPAELRHENDEIHKMLSEMLHTIPQSEKNEDEMDASNHATNAEEMVSICDSELERELRKKLAIFDELCITRSDCSQFVYPREQTNLSDPDLSHRSLILNESCTNIRKKLAIFRTNCVKLFQRLHSTAAFLQTLLAEYGVTEGVQELIDQFNNLPMDIDLSLSLASEISSMILATERSVSEFLVQVDQTNQFSMNAPQGEIQLVAKQTTSVKQHPSKAMKQAICDLRNESQSLQEQLKELSVNADRAVEAVNARLAKCSESITHMSASHKMIVQEKALLKKERDLFESMLSVREQEIYKLEQTVISKCNLIDQEKLKYEMATSNLKQITEERDACADNMNKMLARCEHELELKNGELKAVQYENENFNTLIKKIISVVPCEFLAKHSPIREKMNNVDLLCKIVTKLVNEVNRVNNTINVYENERLTTKANYSTLLREKESLINEIADRQQTIESLKARKTKITLKNARVQTSTDLCWISSLEAENHRLRTDFSGAKENIEQLITALATKKGDQSKMLSRTAEKFEISLDIASIGMHSVDSGTMTKLSGKGIEITLHNVASFIGKLHFLVTESAGRSIQPLKAVAIAGKIEKFYYELASKKFFGQPLEGLSKRLHEDKKRLMEILSSFEQQHHEYRCDSSSIEPFAQKTVNNAMAKSKAPTLSKSNILPENVFYSIDYIIKKLLAMDHQANLMDENVISLVEIATDLRLRMCSMSKTDVGVDQVKDAFLERENERLQAALNDAMKMLENFKQERKCQPDSDAICRRIANEIKKINGVLVDTTCTLQILKKENMKKRSKK